MSEVINSCFYRTRIKLICVRIQFLYTDVLSPGNKITASNDSLFYNMLRILFGLFEELGFSIDKSTWNLADDFLKKYEKEVLDEDYIKSFELITQTMEQIARHFELRR